MSSCCLARLRDLTRPASQGTPTSLRSATIRNPTSTELLPRPYRRNRATVCRRYDRQGFDSSPGVRWDSPRTRVDPYLATANCPRLGAIPMPGVGNRVFSPHLTTCPRRQRYHRRCRRRSDTRTAPAPSTQPGACTAALARYPGRLRLESVELQPPAVLPRIMADRRTRWHRRRSP